MTLLSHDSLRVLARSSYWILVRVNSRKSNLCTSKASNNGYGNLLCLLVVAEDTRVLWMQSTCNINYCRQIIVTAWLMRAFASAYTVVTAVYDVLARD
jgi:hypothetical protein